MAWMDFGLRSLTRYICDVATNRMSCWKLGSMLRINGLFHLNGILMVYIYIYGIYWGYKALIRSPLSTIHFLSRDIQVGRHVVGIILQYPWIKLASFSSWWQLKHFLCSTLPGEMIQFDEHIFHLGGNHQLVLDQKGLFSRGFHSLLVSGS